MTQSKNTKKALLMSMLSMLICITMLIGSTFAWFTDSVTSGKNTIIAGNLDVEMEYSVLGADGTRSWKPVTEETSLFEESALWEPGYTQVVYLKISNVGSLSLNYKLAVSIAKEKSGTRYDDTLRREVNFLLSDYLKFGAVETSAENFYKTRTEAREAVEATAGKLKSYSATGSIKASEAESDIKYITLVVYMPETVDNEANHIRNLAPEIDLGINLIATQMVDESDSFGNDYDADASLKEAGAFDELDQSNFELSSESDLHKLQDLVFNGNTFEDKTITLANDITLAREWTPIGDSDNPFKGTFDGAGKTISGLKITKTTSDSSNSVAGLFGVVDNATIKNLRVEGEISLEGTPAESYKGDGEDVIITGIIGGICGIDKGNSIFDTCTNAVKITVEGVNLDLVVGGILGTSEAWSHAATIRDSKNEADIFVDNTLCEDSFVGGILGLNGPSNPVHIESCENTGKVSGGTLAGNIYPGYPGE